MLCAGVKAVGMSAGCYMVGKIAQLSYRIDVKSHTGDIAKETVTYTLTDGLELFLLMWA